MWGRSRQASAECGMVRGIHPGRTQQLCPRIPTIVSTLYLIPARPGLLWHCALQPSVRPRPRTGGPPARTLADARDRARDTVVRKPATSDRHRGDPGRRFGSTAATDLAFDEYRAEPLIKAWLARQATGTIAPAVLSAPFGACARIPTDARVSGFTWVAGELDDAAPERWPAFRARVTQGLDALLENAGRGRRIALCTCGRRHRRSGRPSARTGRPAVVPHGRCATPR